MTPFFIPEFHSLLSFFRHLKDKRWLICDVCHRFTLPKTQDHDVRRRLNVTKNKYSCIAIIYNSGKFGGNLLLPVIFWNTKKGETSISEVVTPWREVRVTCMLTNKRIISKYIYTRNIHLYPLELKILYLNIIRFLMIALL